MTVKTIIGTTVGLLLGIFLEYVNGFFTFMLPPYLVILPLSVLIGAGVGALLPDKRHNDTHVS